jgi:hypothetical protein
MSRTRIPSVTAGRQRSRATEGPLPHVVCLRAGDGLPSKGRPWTAVVRAPLRRVVPVTPTSAWIHPGR